MSRLDDLFAPYPERLTVEQLAELLGVKLTTAYTWLQKGVVPAYKVGHTWVILRDEVRDHLEARRNISAPPDTRTTGTAQTGPTPTAPVAADQD